MTADECANPLGVLKHGIGYDLIVVLDGDRPTRAPRRLVLGIRCHACQRVSYHPKDIEERYCGACHVFHDDNSATWAGYPLTWGDEA